ncbi:unnamed protein product [Paramecium pentaurelia]|uniref:Transmembrane protein n=1 Tax=Paramecium pentaurelia TaxID=43138 RepID=A0A8S1VYD3_9CILI|nr:unnamed protein product [Paramecium pentaurelia]
MVIKRHSKQKLNRQQYSFYLEQENCEQIIQLDNNSSKSIVFRLEARMSPWLFRIDVFVKQVFILINLLQNVKVFSLNYNICNFTHRQRNFSIYENYSLDFFDYLQISREMEYLIVIINLLIHILCYREFILQLKILQIININLFKQKTIKQSIFKFLPFIYFTLFILYHFGTNNDVLKNNYFESYHFINEKLCQQSIVLHCVLFCWPSKIS